MAHDLVVVGASLGGLTALETLLSGVPRGFRPAIAIVQHRSPESGPALAQILSRRAPAPVVDAEDSEPIVPGGIVLAPPAYHLLVEKRGRFSLSTEGAVSWARPSIDVLFESAAEAYGRRAVGILLTGSSDDGAAGIAAIGRRGGRARVEGPATAESPVAPRAALERWPRARVSSIDAMAPLLLRLLGGTGRRRAAPTPDAVPAGEPVEIRRS
jgi:two-component system chemotaxis response regulator CheB